MRYSGKILGIVAVIALLVTACSAGTAAVVPAASDGEMQNVISVSGSGEVSAAPDTAYISLGIEAMGNDLDKVLEEANGNMAAIFDAVKALGVEEKDIQTSNFNVWLEQIREPDGNRPTGEQLYHVNSALTVKVRALETTGDVISAALEAGANQINGLSFGIEDTDALEAEARAAAVADAKEKAEQLAEVLGVKLGDPVVVSEGGGAVAPVARGAFDMVMAESAAPTIAGGELTVSIYVSVSFAIGK